MPHAGHHAITLAQAGWGPPVIIITIIIVIIIRVMADSYLLTTWLPGRQSRDRSCRPCTQADCGSRTGPPVGQQAESKLTDAVFFRNVQLPATALRRGTRRADGLGDP